MELSQEFQKRFHDFSSFEHHFALFPAPFIFDAVKAEEILRMELLEMQLDSVIRAKYLEVEYLASFHIFMKSLQTSESLHQGL